ncbi:MAG: sugar phosphate isomerase/epimerase family protein [Clostridia bacterium]
MSQPVIAAQLFTIRDYTETPEDIAQSMKKIKEMGYNAVQVSGFGPIEHQQVKDIMDSQGLTICATHIGFDRLQNDLEDVIEQHKLWNCKYVGLGSMPAEYATSRDGYIAFAKEASEIARKLADNGLRFIYHNHHFEFMKFDGVTGMEILFEETDPEVFDFELDTYWIQAGGANPVDWIYKVKGRMKVIHFKDMGVSSERQVIMTEVGEGNLNWPAIIQACKETGVEWCPVEQDICQRNPFESLAISLENLKKLGLQA